MIFAHKKYEVKVSSKLFIFHLFSIYFPTAYLCACFSHLKTEKSRGFLRLEINKGAVSRYYIDGLWTT